MVEIKLPFKTIKVCEICGASNGLNCETTPIEETTDLKIGDVVKKYEPIWKEGSGYIGVSAQPEEWRVIRLFYAQPMYQIYLTMFNNRPRTHELCIELSQSQDNLKKPPRAWREGDSSKTWQTLTFSDFLLWQKGNREELEEIGYIEPPEPERKTLMSRLGITT